MNTWTLHRAEVEDSSVPCTIFIARVNVNRRREERCALLLMEQLVSRVLRCYRRCLFDCLNERQRTGRVPTGECQSCGSRSQ